MKSFTYMALVALFSGCAITEDVSSKLPLNPEQLEVVQAMQASVSTVCVTVIYVEDVPRGKGGVTIRKQGKVVRLYDSNAGWFKGLVMAQGTVDDIYYNSIDKSTICGQKSWDKFPDTSQIEFKEIGVPTK